MLFTVQEVLQAFLGFSFFELLYRPHLQGVLDILRKEWEETQPQLPPPVPHSAYFTVLREKLKARAALGREALGAVQVREFVSGQLVLLLPMSANKLQVKW